MSNVCSQKVPGVGPKTDVESVQRAGREGLAIDEFVQLAKTFLADQDHVAATQDHLEVESLLGRKR